MNWQNGPISTEARRWVGQLADPAKRERAAAGLLRMGAEAAPALIEALRSHIPGLPQVASQLLTQLGTAATPALVDTLGNGLPGLPAKAASILAETKDSRAVPALLQALRNEDEILRWQAVSALGEIVSPLALPALLEALKDPQAQVRAMAIRAVGRYNDPRSFDRMADLLLDDPLLEVRQAAAKAFGETRHPEAVPYLMLALADSFWWYEREQAAGELLDAVARIGAPAVDALTLALKNPEGAVRRFSAMLLGRIGDPRAIEALGMALYDMHSEVGRAAAESLAGFGEDGLEILVEALNHPEAWLRQHAVHGLALSGDKRVVPALLEMLDDPEREVIKLVIQSLGTLEDERAAPALTKIALHREDRELSSLAREALKMLGA